MMGRKQPFDHPLRQEAEASPAAPSPGRLLLATCLAAVATLAACTAQDAESRALPEEAAHVTMEGKVILVTGSTDGLGRAVALRLASAGAHVIVHGRNEDRGADVVRGIEEEGVGSARFIRADLASLADVRELAATIRSEYGRLDVLVNNAGIGRGVDQTLREVSEDGHELRFQVNYLAGFLLTYELLPLLVASAPSRVVNVASAAQRAMDFDDLMLERAYDGSRAYEQSKLAQVLFTFDLAEELEGSGVTVNALHPASMMPTTMVLERGGEPRSEIEEGVEAVLALVLTPDAGTGGYFSGTRPARANAQAYDADARRRLRELARELTGVADTRSPRPVPSGT